MHNYPKKKAIQYPVPLSLKIDEQVAADMDLADQHGIDTAELSRRFLREGYAKVRADIEAGQSEAC